jgi:hypothetical protein
MGEMTAIKIMRQLLKEWTLPDEMKVKWDSNNNQEIAHAEKIFSEYLAEGWIAYIDEPKGRKQIFKFDPKFTKIVLMPPLGGG